MYHQARKRKWVTSPAFILTASIALTFLISRLYYHFTDDFRLANITYELPHHKEWSIPPLQQEEKVALKTILSQPFYYLDKGSQCYACVSQDQKYVVKFFKFKHLKPHWFVESLPPIFPFSLYRAQQASRKKRKLEGLFSSYHLAYEAYREESGLIYIHLNKTHDQHPSLTVFDKIGWEKRIDLDEVVFLIQKKGKTTRTLLTYDFARGDLQAVANKIEKLFDLYASKYRRGLLDKDHGILHNTGFIETTPLHLDVGKLIRSEAMKEPREALKDIQLVAQKIRQWVHNKYPQHEEKITQVIEAKIQALYPPLNL